MVNVDIAFIGAYLVMKMNFVRSRVTKMLGIGPKRLLTAISDYNVLSEADKAVIDAEGGEFVLKHNLDTYNDVPLLTDLITLRNHYRAQYTECKSGTLLISEREVKYKEKLTILQGNYNELKNKYNALLSKCKQKQIQKYKDILKR